MLILTCTHVHVHVYFVYMNMYIYLIIEDTRSSILLNNETHYYENFNS